MVRSRADAALPFAAFALPFAAFAFVGTPAAFAAPTACGGNSASFAEVRPPSRKAKRGPIVVVPDSLCADLIEDRRGAVRSIDVMIDPREGPGVSPESEAPDRPRLPRR
jgi:hypothetical protein